MKKIFIIFFVFLFQSTFVIANTSIVFIDMDKIIYTSKPGLSLTKQLNKINSENTNKFDEKTKNLKQQETKLISQKNILSEENFNLSVNKLKLEIKNYNDSRNKTINNFNKLKINNTNNFLKKINPILKKYSIDKSISIILQKKDLIIGKTELDITDEIIKIINTEVKEFKLE